MESGEIGSLRNIFGSFIYINLSFANNLKDIEATMLARLTYLATYISYNDNIIRTGNKQFATKSHLATMLNLSKTNFYRFYRQVIDSGYLSVTKDGYHKLNPDLFVKGNAEEFSDNKCRVMSTPYRDAYKGVKDNEHIYLGYCIKLMSCANKSWNVLCSNDGENNVDKIHGLTIGEIANVLGKSRKAIGQIIDGLAGVRYTYKGFAIAQLASVFYFDGRSKGVIINPQIFYRGSGFYKFVAYDIFKNYLFDCVKSKKGK